MLDVIKKLLPAMIEHGGSIINVTSDAGITGYPGWGGYGISKFGRSFGFGNMSEKTSSDVFGFDNKIVNSYLERMNREIDILELTAKGEKSYLNMDSDYESEPHASEDE